MRHPERRRLLDFDGLSCEERQVVLKHARSCAACRGLLVTDDPARLFALLRLEPLPEAALERLSDRVATEIDRDVRPAARFRRGWSAASLAASLILGAVLGSYLLTARIEEPVVALDSASAPAEESVSLVREATAPDTDPVRGVELISSPGAGKLVNLSVGETRVVMIFDEALDI
jgi:hypothetical protein